MSSFEAYRERVLMLMILERHGFTLYGQKDPVWAVRRYLDRGQRQFVELMEPEPRR